MDQTPILVTVADAARHTGLAPATLRRWAWEGRITRHGRPRALRLDYRELREYDRTNPHNPLRAYLVRKRRRLTNPRLT